MHIFAVKFLEKQNIYEQFYIEDPRNEFWRNKYKTNIHEQIFETKIIRLKSPRQI